MNSANFGLMFKDFRTNKLPVIAAFHCLLFAGAATFAQTDQAIYTDSLQNGWDDWSWSATRNVDNSSPVHGGSKSISVSLTAWGALSLHHTDINTATYTNLTFWIHGGTTGGQQLKIFAELGTSAQPSQNLPVLIANTWQQVTFSLAALGVANQPNFARFSIQDAAGITVPTFFIDDITLVGTTNTTPPPGVTNAPVTVTINAALNQRPIDPLIYGVAFASASQLDELNAPVNRWGGNSTTRYNWQLNADNKGNDWYYQSIGGSSSTPGADADAFVSSSKTGGAEPMLTVPMVGWMPKLGAGRSKLSSYSITKYGPQTGNDWQWFADAGNGISTTNNTPITWNNPNDANFLTNSAFQQAWIRHLTNTWNLSTNGGVRYYCMDNEHTLWNSTHRDIHPIGTTMQEIRDKFFDYAGKVKAVDPNALLLAPEEWGWTGYFYSGFDAQWASANNGWGNPALMPDRSTNGAMDYMPWFLDQARQRATNTNQRLLDYFTLHIYPQGGEFSDDTSNSMQLRRNRSTRSLWDPAYIDETWINSVVRLIPRMRGWVTNYYPGTKTGITEYNWGAEGHINGATAQADIYGIFGREGLDLATRWTTPTNTSPTFKAMKMYRNYDGNNSTFGDISISASGANPDNISTFAALRASDGALTIMAINKQLSSNAPVYFNLTNFLSGGTAQVWRLTSANTISQLANVNFTGNTFSNMLPAQSITLFIVSPGASPSLQALGANGGQFNFRLNGQAGQRYALHSSSNLSSWQYFQTNTLTSNSLPITVSLTNAQRFYRTQWLP